MVVHDLATFVKNADYEDLSEQAVKQLKIRLLDSLGTAIGAIEGPPVQAIRSMIDDYLGGTQLSTLIGGGKTTPERAALYNSALVRYLDFNDSYLAKGETCHPSDNIGSILAAGENTDIIGKEFLTSLAIAYQIQCRLSDEAPVRDKGFDHTTQGSYAVAAGVSRALGLDEEQTANAIAIAGTALNALRVTRTGALSNWKGLAYPHTAFGGTHAALMAKHGITGPPAVFEGNKGFMDSIAGKFSIDWQNEDLERVTNTIIKKYNAEIHSQSSIEGMIELKKQHCFTAEEVMKIDIEIFDVAYHIIGGGEEGDKTVVRTKEEADHSLQYMVSAALLDGQVLPEQYRPNRIEAADIQSLLQKVEVTPRQEYSDRFPDEMPVKITVHLMNGQKHEIEKQDYEGFHTRPMNWDTVTQKFIGLAEPYTSQKLRERIVNTVQDLENHSIRELTNLLQKVELVSHVSTNQKEELKR
ncbi:MmgE/PrpD family protein [Aliifodinibius sp. S!AR15-10]|uniref:MmgE/PrpD family protein n=1 Tax=Aliifodinibius sp. S!AR15-10 TaxID=2950437 RepID=UPI002856ABCF|nr:MmgE/PrpD family protein [Aliifodinibius sp. S!AR15-10]MDR8389973.1 MmgE/PrpD family protein [Aliifodinibius sp. S!AR15-10]